MNTFGQAGYTMIDASGARYGPVDAQTLRGWISAGRVVATSMIEDPISGMTRPAAQMPEFGDLFPGTGIGTGMPPSAPPGTTASGATYSTNQYAAYPNAGTLHASPPKSKIAAILLAFFLGGFGIHRFYLGHTGSGIAMLLITVVLGIATCGLATIITWVWAIVDIVLIATDALKDSDGRATV